MSDQNLQDQNKSNQNMNAQPETASDQLAPDDATINGNLFVTGYVAVGPFAATTGQGGIDVTGPVAEFSFVKRTLTSWPAQPAAGDRFVWYNPDGTARLYTDVKGDLLTVTANGNVGIGTNPSLNQAQLHVEGKVIYSGGSRGGLSFGNRDTSGFVESPTKGERWAWYSSGGTARLWSGGDKLSINANGNVGIGTTNPEGILHLNSARGNIKMLATSGGGADFNYDGGADSLFWFTHYGKDTGDTRFLWSDGTKTTDLLTLQNKGNVGIGTPAPSEKLEVAGNVKCVKLLETSSRESKENIAELSGKEAVEALKNLNPVKFNFKADSDKNLHLGFIAEDVPELVATSDRKTLSPMDIVAVLTQALKEQQNTISALAEKVKLLEAKTA